MGSQFDGREDGRRAVGATDDTERGGFLGYIEAMKTYNAIRAEFDGTITAILVNSGDAVEEDDVIMKIAKQ